MAGFEDEDNLAEQHKMVVPDRPVPSSPVERLRQIGRAHHHRTAP
jgi:hypothetical protein